MKLLKNYLPFLLLLTLAFTSCKQPSVSGTNSYPTKNPSDLPAGLAFIEVNSDDHVTSFIKQSGVKSTAETGEFFSNLYKDTYPELKIGPLTPPWAGCSAFLISDGNGGYYAGRNFDWSDYSDAVIIRDRPSNGDYASVCTFNKMFVTYGGNFSSLPSNVQKKIVAETGLFVPVDGFNEKGLCVFVLNQENRPNENITNENTTKPDVTLTSAVRLLLNKTKTVDEAVALLKKYDMHSDISLAHHLFIADANGKSVAVEWDNNSTDTSKHGMKVTETKVLANHPVYKATAEYGFTEDQLKADYPNSMERFNAIKNKIASKNNKASFDDAKEIIHSSHQDSTRWTIVYHITKGYSEETFHWSGEDGKWKSNPSNWTNAKGYVVSAR